MSIDEEYLQQVMRSAAHDISAALRAATGFSSLIAKQYESQLDKTALHWLSLMGAEGEKAQKKLTAFSRYARLYAIEGEPTSCDLNVLCQRAIPVDFSVDLESLPNMQGYSSLWLELFNELIRNAQQHSDSEACRIYHRDEAGVISIVVEDQGKGVPRDKLDYVLSPFRSLVEEDQSGMGLSIVKRIVEIHGGEFSVDTGFYTDKKPGFRVVARFTR